MIENVLQEGEKAFIIQGVLENIRNDGRGCLDYRAIELETDVIPQANGSAMVKIGDTRVIAVVKAELTAPLPPHSPDEGWIEISVECTPHAGLEFEGRGGDDFSSDLSQILMQICNNKNHIDLKKLCVVAGEHVWILYVDIMVLGHGGNLMDVISIATKAALFNTKIQVVKTKTDDSNAPVIEFSEDPHDLFSLNVTNLPCLLTLNRIGTEFIVDATKEEEVCCKAKLLFAVSPAGVVLTKQIGGEGSLHTDSIYDITETGYEMGAKLLKELNAILEAEKDLPKKKKCLF